MPKKLKSCVKKVTAKGAPKSKAYPICVKSTGQKPHKSTKQKSSRKMR